MDNSWQAKAISAKVAGFGKDSRTQQRTVPSESRTHCISAAQTDSTARAIIVRHPFHAVAQRQQYVMRRSGGVQGAQPISKCGRGMIKTCGSGRECLPA